jgi:hypothetical protein
MLAALQLCDLGHLRHGGARMGVGDGQAQGVGGIGAGQPIDRPFLGDPLSFRTGLRGAGRFDSL